MGERVISDAFHGLDLSVAIARESDDASRAIELDAHAAAAGYCRDLAIAITGHPCVRPRVELYALADKQALADASF